MPRKLGQKNVDLGTLDSFIARQLAENPSNSQAAIATEVSKKLQARSRGAIQSRIASMSKRGILRKGTMVVNWDEIGLPLKFRIDIQINQDALLNSASGGGPLVGLDKKPFKARDNRPINTQEAVAKFVKFDLISYILSTLDEDSPLVDLADQLFVEDVVILLGNPNADLTAVVRARSHGAILKFVTGGLRMMRGVSRTSTHQEAWSCPQPSLKSSGG